MADAVNEREATELESDNELLTSDTELEAELSSSSRKSVFHTE